MRAKNIFGLWFSRDAISSIMLHESKKYCRKIKVKGGIFRNIKYKIKRKIVCLRN